MSAIPSAGWKSRKVIVGLTVLVLLIFISTAAMFYHPTEGAPALATFDQWSGFVQVLVPSVLLPLFTAMGWEQRQLRLAKIGTG